LHSEKVELEAEVARMELLLDPVSANALAKVTMLDTSPTKASRKRKAPAQEDDDLDESMENRENGGKEAVETADCERCSTTVRPTLTTK
jgi:hypothetical protein